MSANTTIDNQTNTLTINDLREPVSSELTALNTLIQQQIFSNVELIQNIVTHILNAGGKRLRPLLVLLSAKALNYQGDEDIELAAVIEFIHTATLLHDDVVDKSELRRNQASANVLWGNEASVLVGDFLYSRAFQILAKRSNIPVTKVLANATNTIAEGELLQLTNVNDTQPEEQRYFDVIGRKTAELFGTASQIGAMIASDNTAIHEACFHYGYELGLAYQISDDMLDYQRDQSKLGKKTGDDLSEGKATLPLIYALKHCTPDEANLIREIIQGKQSGASHFNTISNIIETTGAMNYCKSHVIKHLDNANTQLSVIPESNSKTSLSNLCQFIQQRIS